MLPKVKVKYEKIEIHLTFGFSNKASDIDNPIKPTLDILQQKMEFNDKQIYRLVVDKHIVKAGKEFIRIEIKEF